MRQSPLMQILILTALLLVVAPNCVFGETPKKAKVENGIEGDLKFKEGDEDGNEVKALKTEILVINAEKQALAQLQKLKAKYKGTPMEPEMLLREAELYMRRARSERFFEIHKTSDNVVKFAPSMVKAASEKKEVSSAIGIFESIQKKFPEFRAIDVVLFNEAYAKQQIGDDKGADLLYQKLVNQHSESSLVPDALLAIGEIRYDQKKFADALEYFKKIRQFPEARVYPYAMYKGAWCYYNLQNASSGLKELEEVVRYGHAMAKQNVDLKLDLRKEALGDMTLFFAEFMPASRAVAYFTQQAGPLDAAPYILKLGKLYGHHGKTAEVEVVLREFISSYPKSDTVPAAYEELIWNNEKMRKRPEAVAQMAEFSRYCAKNEERKVECQTRLGGAAKALANKWHALWKTKMIPPELADSAEEAYSIYLGNKEPNDPEENQNRFAFAELLFKRQKFRQSSDEYAEIANHKPDKQMGHDAAYGAIVGLEKSVPGKWGKKEEKRFVQLAEVYLRVYPQGEYALDIRFKQSFIAYENERYDEAAAGFKQIGWNYPSSERVLKAQDLYLDILNLKKDFTNLKEAAKSLVGKTSDKARSLHMEKLYREAYFSEIQQREEKGDFKGAIADYKKFAQSEKGSELAAKAWWNSSQLQFKIGDAEGGAQTCYEMYRLFPSSPNIKNCLSQAAQSFEALARVELAAKVLVDLAQVDSAQAVKWKELAADFFALSGNRERAIEFYSKLLDATGPQAVSQATKVELIRKIWALEKEQNNTKGIKSIQTRILQNGVEPYASQITVEQAESELASGDLNKAFNTSKKIISKDYLAKDLLARARFVQASVLEDEFRKQSTKAQVDRITIVLGLKTDKLDKAQKAFQSAIKYGDARVSVAALRRLSGCYLHYAQAVKAIKLPDETPENDRNAFRDEMDKLAIPMEEKGIDTMVQALEAAKKFQIRDGTIGEIQNEIDQLNHKAATNISVKIVVPPPYLPRFPASMSATRRGEQ